MKLLVRPMPSTVRLAAYRAGNKPVGFPPVKDAAALKVSKSPLFPLWVETPKRQPPSELARKRLRYLMSKTMLERTKTGSQDEIAERCGVVGTTISAFITNGKFSRVSAVRFERAFGRDWIPLEWLLEPLAIS